MTPKAVAAGLAGLILSWMGYGRAQENSIQLPRPAAVIPGMPAVTPVAITAGGQRLLLNQAGVAVQYDSTSRSLSVNPPGWWIVNYPLTRIKGLEGLSAEEIGKMLFGVGAAQVRNWYIKTPGAPDSEPATPR